MGFNYEFRPVKDVKGRKEDKSSEKNVNKNKLLIAVLIVLAALLFVGVSSSVTGYVTYREGMNKQLEYTVQELADVTKQNEQCGANLFSALEKEEQCKSQLSTKDGQLNSCTSQKSDLENQKIQAESLYSACNAEKEEINVEYQKALNDIAAGSAVYDQFARNSARSVCCSIGDVLNGAVKHWGISENNIVCSDTGRTVNCGTGETDF